MYISMGVYALSSTIHTVAGATEAGGQLAGTSEE